MSRKGASSDNAVSFQFKVRNFLLEIKQISNDIVREPLEKYITDRTSETSCLIKILFYIRHIIFLFFSLTIQYFFALWKI